MIFISKKRFREEVERKARATVKFSLVEAMAEDNAERIGKLEKRISQLEKKQQKGSINGFYAAPAATTIIRKEAEE